eukprot:1663177-Rhodomonas_salina.2
MCLSPSLKQSKQPPRNSNASPLILRGLPDFYALPLTTAGSSRHNASVEALPRGAVAGMEEGMRGLQDSEEQSRKPRGQRALSRYRPDPEHGALQGFMRGVDASGAAAGATPAALLNRNE